MTEQSEFFGSGFFPWQLGGADHYRRLYEETGYDEQTHWGGFSREPVGVSGYRLPTWAVGPFVKYDGNPVLAPAAEGWDRGRFSGGVHNGAVVRKDDLFYYLYRGEQPLPDGYWDGSPQSTDMQEIDYICDIGIATSQDGVTFTRRTDHSPLFRRGDDEAYSYEDTCVVHHDGTYYIYCNRWDWKDNLNPTRNGVHIATSSDLLTWEKRGLAFPTAGEIHRNACVLQDPDNNAVRVDDGRFVMYLNNGLIAYSDDLLHWESTKVPNLWPGGEGCFALAGHASDRPDDIVLFTGGHHTGHFYAVGEVLLSTADPARPIDWLPRPVLAAEEKYPWENCYSPDDPGQMVSSFRDTIFFTGMTRCDGKWWLYYGGSEVYTCLARADAEMGT